MNQKVTEDTASLNQAADNDHLMTIVRGAKVDLFGRMFNAGIRYFYVMLLAWFLGAEGMGIFFLGLVLIEFFGVLSRMGLESGVLKYVAIYFGQGEHGRIKGTIQSAVRISLAASVIFGCILFLSAEFISVNIFNKPALENVIKILSIALPFSTLTMVALAGTQAFHTLKYRVYVEFFTNPISNIVLIGVFFLIGIKLAGVAFAYVLSFVICALLAFFFLIKLFPELTTSELKPISETKTLIRFSMPLLFVNFLNLIVMWTDVLMLGYFETAAAVGIYNTAVRTAYFINFIIMSFTAIFAPRISDLYHRGKFDELAALFKTVSRWILGFSIPVFLMIALMSKSVLLLFGANFVVGYLSLSILAFAHLANAGVGSVKYMLMMSENEKLVMYDTIGVCVLNILLNALLIPKFGIIGAAIATASSIVIINLVMLFQVYQRLGFHPYNIKFYKPVISGVVVALIGWFVAASLQLQNQVAILVGGIILFSAGYLLIMRIMGLDEEDRLVLRTLLLKFGKS